MVKDALLSLLEEGRGGFLSGEEVAARLGVTRNAVWKAAEALRQAGYPVEAVKNRGYRLAEGSDKLSPQGVGKYLSARPPVRVEVLPSAPSTNDLVRARAEAGENLTEYLQNTRCGDVLDEAILQRYCLFDAKATVFDVFEAFEKQKDLYAVIVTEHGVVGEKVILLLTPSDFPAINRYLEAYNAKTF